MVGAMEGGGTLHVGCWQVKNGGAITEEVAEGRDGEGCRTGKNREVVEKVGAYWKSASKGGSSFFFISSPLSHFATSSFI